MFLDYLWLNKNSSKLEPGTQNLEERPERSILKSITWRIVGTADTVIISWIVTGELTLAFSIGFVELLSKMILYFVHERVWNRVRWGK
ncbi:DUF2061 domain-containing protein [Lentiprolixibacter aurantiacus]|uniref:DUF2061 domain-containing protein n=1 Tax=Lentiprolixibacter aurantiacus TaxID=2993939 RepID=A0AAE3MK49_9FLAO|nr:DUF2061 domain-containing protein [Lentiprolixibacter aurantiacus]MCX2719126.1 DUF2061 domain-containing protein [Lentiprolixibacter aurantiacus]